MPGSQTLINFATLILASTPISLLILHFFKKILTRQNPLLGKTTCICTETKGILLKNKLVIKSLLFDNKRVNTKTTNNLVKITNLDTKESFSVEKAFLQKNTFIQLMTVATHICHYKKIKDIEHIISVFFKKCGLGKDRIENDYEILQRIPSYEKKKLSSTVAIKNYTKEIFSFSKGNPKAILKKCSRMMIKDKKIDLTPALKRKLIKKIEKLNKNGQKLIAFAYKALPKKRLKNYKESFVEKDLTFIGMVGLGHPINQDLSPSIEKAKNLGLKVYILTKIKERNAVAVAKHLGIINPNYFESFTGSYLRTLNEQKLKKMLSNKKKDFVFADLNEDDRLKILKTLKSSDEVIAITTKEENSFEEIIQSIQKDKLITSNSHKFTSHAFICKLAETTLILATLIMKVPLPLTIFGILEIEILINLILEYSLQFDKDSQKSSHSISYTIIKGLGLGAVLTGTYFFNLLRYGISLEQKINLDNHAVAKSMTITFMTLIFTQIISAFMVRNRQKSIFINSPLKNPYLILTTIISILILYAAYIFPTTKALLNLGELTQIDWQIIIFSVLGMVIIEEIIVLLTKKNNEPISTKGSISPDQSHTKEQ